MTQATQSVVEWLKSVTHPETHLRLDSREVKPGDIFVALPGAHVDGRHFIPVAVARGAAAVLLEEPEAPLPAAGVPALAVKGLAEQLGVIAAGFYDNPTEKCVVSQ